MSVEQQIIEYVLQVDLSDESYKQIRQAELLVSRLLSLLRRANLPEDVDRAVSVLQKLIVVAMQARTQLLLLNSTLVTTPVGLAIFLVGLAGTAASGLDMLSGY